MGKAGCSVGLVGVVEVGDALEVGVCVGTYVGVGVYLGVGVYAGVVIGGATAGGGGATGGGATGVEIGDRTAGPGAGPGASQGATLGTEVLVCDGDTGPPSGGVGEYRSVAITRPRTTTPKIVITIPRTEIRSFNLSIVIPSTGARP